MVLGSKRGRRASAGVMLAVLVLVSGCGPKPAVAPPNSDLNACAIGPAVDPAHAAIHIGVTEDVDWSHAPAPTNDAERLIFRQCYETLVRVDCTGEVRPGLAESWESSDDGRVWTFTLRPEARFWNGAEATAPTVARFWTDRWAWSFVPESAWIDWDSVMALDGRRLQVALTQAGQAAGSVRLFAHPYFAVALPRHPDLIPLGTGPLQAVLDIGGVDISLVWPYDPRLAESLRGRRESAEDWGLGETVEQKGPVIMVTVSPGADPRDLLAEGADLVLDRSRSFADYAGRLPDFEVVPLPWDRIYVLLAPRGDHRSGPEPGAYAGDEGILFRLREDLAGQGWHSDTRPAHGLSFDVSLSGACPDPRGGTPAEVSEPPPSRARIVYPADDLDAGPLSERLGALALMRSNLLDRTLPASLLAGTEVPLKTQALYGPSLEEALRRQDSYGYVVALRREAYDRCGHRAHLYQAVPWLESGPDDHGPDMLPLVVTRPVLAMRRGLGGLRVDGDGTLLLHGAGWIEEEATP